MHHPTSTAEPGNRWWRDWWTGAGVLVVSAGLGAGALDGRWKSQQDSRQRAVQTQLVQSQLPASPRGSGFVGSQNCLPCHQQAHATWWDTYHRTMTQPALPDRVLGRFDGTEVVAEGLRYRVGREGDAFWAEMPDPDLMMYAVQGDRPIPIDQIPRVRRPVVMATGSHHYQTYWVSSERHPGLLQTLPLVWLIEDQRWIPREAAFMRGPADQGRFITQWNHHCIRCHSTGGNPGLDPATGQLNTEVGELGIACEACHGPGEQHVLRHQNPLERYRALFNPGTDSTIVNPEKLDHRRSSEVCGQCHGVFVLKDEFAMEFAQQGNLYRPGDALEDTRYYILHPRVDPTPERREEWRKNPAFFREGWWEDGTILAGGREFTGLLASACFQKGTMSCLSCHGMHGTPPADQLLPGMDTGQACISCHNEPQYTTEVTRHTFHPPGSAGSDCLNCHMPHTTYALLKAIRSHQIESPTARWTARFGVPNACNLCHLDRSLGWTATHLSQWYGQPPVILSDEQQEVSAALLGILKGHAAQRVIYAWHVGWAPAQEASGTDWLPPFHAHLLEDPYGVIRHVAGRSLARLPGFAGFQNDFLAPPEDWARKNREVQATWEQLRSGHGPGRVGPDVLRDPQGSVIQDRVSLLLEHRDQRSVTIKE